MKDRGLTDVFRNVKTYIYNRADAMGPGFNYHLKTNTSLKVSLMERLRDFTQNGMLRIRSMSYLEEARTIARDGDSIEAPGSMKDDRVLAMSFAVHCWEDRCRKDMMLQHRTRESEAARQRLSITDQVYLFQQNQLSQFFAAKSRQRTQDRMAAVRSGWRNR